MTQPIGAGQPHPVQGVTGGPGLPQGVASVDGTTGNVVISPPNNTVQFRKTDSPQALQIYEYFHNATDFSRLALNAQTGGPFQIEVETQPPGVIRDLVISASGTVTIQASELFVPETLSANILLASTLQANPGQTLNISANASPFAIIFSIGATQPWAFTPTFQFTPTATNLYDIGAVTNRVRRVFATTIDVSLIGQGNGPAASLGLAGGTAFGPTLSPTSTGWIRIETSGTPIYTPYWQ